MPRPRALSAEDVRTIRDLYAADTRQTALALDYGVSQATISSLVRGDSYQDIGGPTSTESRVRILTEKEVVEIREAYAKGASTTFLGAEYGCGAGNIQSLVTGKTWPKVGGPITRRRPAREES
jgi:hypothetical protein